MTQLFTATLVVETCCNCGINFGITRDFYGKRREDHKSFYCPAGHSQYYSGKSETEKKQEEIDRLNNSITHLRTANDNLHDQMVSKNHQIRESS